VRDADQPSQGLDRATVDIRALLRVLGRLGPDDRRTARALVRELRRTAATSRRRPLLPRAGAPARCELDAAFSTAIEAVRRLAAAPPAGHEPARRAAEEAVVHLLAQLVGGLDPMVDDKSRPSATGEAADPTSEPPTPTHEGPR
jgi:hypothetical protein